MPGGIKVNYEIDRPFADLFAENISMITGLEIKRQGTKRQDTKQGIDMVIPSVTLSLRIRRMSLYHGKYRDQITFRYARNNGMKTEWDKMLNGEYKAKIFFYGFGEEHSREVKAYTMIDMPCFIQAIPTMELDTPVANHDSATWLQPVNIHAIPRECILAHKKLVDPVQRDLFVTKWPMRTQFVLVK